MRSYDDEVKIDFLNKEIVIKRVLGQVKGVTHKATIIVFAGIHGNEKAGLFAIDTVLNTIEDQKIDIKGNLYAICGNIPALIQNKRFINSDLNRLWTHDQIKHLEHISTNSDTSQQKIIYKLIKDILAKEKGPFYFIDLHTTSAKTSPFITISDSINNRKFSSKFGIPVILGIEEYLEGPLLTYINEFGHIALGFEAGQHDEEASIKNSEAFLWLALEASGCISKNQITLYTAYKEMLTKFISKTVFYEIDFRYPIKTDESFKMINGFKNFDRISEGQVLASSNGSMIRSILNGYIFMPLYQDKGDDGFFIITKISSFWLKFSTIARRLHLFHLLRLLPGIRIDTNFYHGLIVNPKTAKFLAKEIFHLFGYRKQVLKDDKLHFIKRDREVTKFR